MVFQNPLLLTRLNIGTNNFQRNIRVTFIFHFSIKHVTNQYFCNRLQILRWYETQVIVVNRHFNALFDRRIIYGIIVDNHVLANRTA